MAGSLTSLANYAASDSDEEGKDYHALSGNISGSDEEGSTNSQPTSRHYSPVIRDDEPPKKKPKPPVSGLVSDLYDRHDDDDEDDSDRHSRESDYEEDAHSVQSSASQSASNGQANSPNAETGTDVLVTDAAKETENGEGIPLPPSPTGRCPKELTEKLQMMHKKLKYGNFTLNSLIQQNKVFRNPSIYEKLIDHVGIDEKGTNYPPELYDPSIWAPSSFYDELAKQQNNDMEKRKAEKKTKVDFVTSTKTSDSEGSGNRKTKWDTQASAVPAAPSAPSNAAINPSVPVVGALIKKK